MLVAIVVIALGALVIWVAPQSKPVVTVYMRADCANCRRWMEHLAARGFRTEVGPQADWPAVRAKFGIPLSLQSSHTAIVDGLFIEGPVPAGDIHRALKWRAAYHIEGVVVPGVPRGSPGMESPLPQPYKVFAVREGGRVQEFAQHGH